MGRLRDRIQKRREQYGRRGLDWRFSLVNTMFWVTCLGASGFDPTFKWWALLFIVVPWVFIGQRRRLQPEEYFEEKPQITPVGNAPSLPAPKEFHIKIIEDAEPFMDQIKSAANVATGALGASLRNMAISLDKVRLELMKQPNKVSNVQRLFTYYAPETANLLAARGKAASANDAQRLSEIDDMLSKLEIAFSQFNSKMEGDDTRAVEIDMKLLSQSLQQDFGKIESKK